MSRRKPRKTPRRPSGTGDHEDGDTKSARTRRRLLTAAAGVLSRQGYAGTRLSDIAEEAQMQAPAIYYYYSSREDLIEEVMYAGAAAMLDHLREALDELPPAANPAAKISTAVEAHLRNELELSEYSKAIIRNGNQLPEQVGARARAEITAYNDIWRSLITDLADTGMLREDLDAGVARMVVLGALNWAAEWWDPERGDLETIISTTQSMVLHALRP
ncbi:TetR/AcrR family transcriptional regulator [Pseudonocardia sp. P1]|uniref:TetR/AcrR family transcriptional regulator n=1 Tax=Pseudonocardia sp. P1 TaxID=761194 RepID=UPI00094AF394|nr:TetR family transcriptional regulator [Pseudonocardia sp. Ae707_Ps1]